MSLHLLINEIPLQAYKWEEEQSDQYMLTINVKLTREEYRKLDKIREYSAKNGEGFHVMIADYVRPMRFGKIIYSDHGDFVKWRATLVEKDRTKELQKFYGKQEKEDLADTVIKLKRANEKLLALLQDKAILTSDEVKQAGLGDETGLVADEVDLFQVEDIDFYLDGTDNKQSGVH
ncbi:hypothetical protein [Sediminibacillus halophilus]|uniref:Uncharacterized protein n=1 Tax=Sediminibacillus halophilus TaxID=482461 RepID=A0A1G9VC91_9BACI|nr:hypothetical protein [Sediminibacillus halophilus]SDM69677.1 hypothetical protein SAMN05216244_3222 [Sediminibacillus halophilus]